METTYTVASQATADAFADWGTAFDKRGIGAATIVINNSGSNIATYQLYGSLDESTWVTIGSGVDVAARTAVAVSVTDYWSFLKVQAKSKTSGQSTNVAIRGAGAPS